MKCPMCGDEIVNGRCRFCGYVPTKEDMDAIAKWELQKSQIKREAGPVDFTPKRKKPKAGGTKTVTVRRFEKAEHAPAKSMDSKNAAKFFEPEPAPDRARKPVKEKKALGIMKIVILVYVIGFLVSFFGALAKILAMLSVG